MKKRGVAVRVSAVGVAPTMMVLSGQQRWDAVAIVSLLLVAVWFLPPDRLEWLRTMFRSEDGRRPPGPKPP